MKPRVVVLDYGSDNLRSAERALARVGADVTVTSDAAMAANSDALVVPTIPVTDLDRAKAFYTQVLGLTPIEESPFSVRLRCGAGSQLSIYKRGPVERGQTVAHFEVSDIEAAVADVRSRGGIFE